MFNWSQKSSEITPKRIEIYRRLGIEVPEPPKFDSDIQSIIETYYLASRARRYIEGSALPLTVRDITDVVNAHPVNVPRSTLDEIIFSLDDLSLSEQRKSSENK